MTGAEGEPAGSLSLEAPAAPTFERWCSLFRSGGLHYQRNQPLTQHDEQLNVLDSCCCAPAARARQVAHPRATGAAVAPPKCCWP